MTLKGHYINLERNHGRRAAMEAMLATAGLGGYRRFSAVDGVAAKASHATELDAGELGLWLSHEAILAGHDSADHLHILEDDAVVSPQAKGILPTVLNYLTTTSPNWDLLFTNIVPPVESVPHARIAQATLARTVGVLNLKGWGFAGTNSLIINQASIAKYADAIRGKWSVGMPIDLFIRSLVSNNSLVAMLTAPFLTTISPHSVASDIRGKHDRSRCVVDAYRRSLFIDADLEAIQREMAELVAASTVPPLHRIFMDARAFLFSDQFESF